MNVHVAVNNSRATLGKIAYGDPAWNSFNSGFVNRVVSPEELMKLVANGYAFTAQHSNSWRQSRNFVQGQALALDMDDAKLSLSQVAELPFFKRYASFAYTTPSHTDENPRLRVVFILDRPIRTASKYRELAESLLARFGVTDQKVKDPARFFYGSVGCLTHWWGNVLTLEDAAAELVLPERKLKEQARLAAEAAAVNRIIIPVGGVSPNLLRAHSEKLLARIRTAPAGEKHITRLNVAITFGGYIANGYYQLTEVRAWLEAAVASNTTNLKAAIQTIDDGLEYGQKRPLHFEVNQTPSGDYPELERVHPPLTPQQKMAVARIIGDREWKAYHDGMTAGERALWRKQGMDDIVIDMLNLGVKHSTDEETGEITEVMTLPYLRGGEIVNVEYRGKDVAYASDTAALYFPEESEHNTPVLVFPNSISSIQSWLHFGHKFRIAGLPEMPITQSMFSGADDYVIIMEPDTDITGRGLGKVKDRVKFLRLPMSMGKMMAAGFDENKMTGYIRNARMA